MARRCAGGVKAWALALVGATERHPAAVAGMRPPRGVRALPERQRARARARAEEGDGRLGLGRGGAARARARGEAGRLWLWAEPEAAAREGRKSIFDF
jgi:hypothetical protein